MSWEYAHLVINHFPIVGTILAVALLAYGWAFSGRSTQRVALSLLVVSAVLGIGAYVTGSRAEAIVEKWPGVAESWIEDHEAAAKLAFAAVLAAGAAALATLVLSRGERPVPTWALLLTFAVGLGAVALLVNAASLGGRIRHPELRPTDAPGAPAQEPMGAAPAAASPGSPG